MPRLAHEFRPFRLYRVSRAIDNPKLQGRVVQYQRYIEDRETALGGPGLEFRIVESDGSLGEYWRIRSTFVFNL